MLWTRNSGQTLSDDSGPIRDHTTGREDGWYVFVPLDAQSDGVAILQSELLGPFTTPHCFGFYYHIYDEDNDEDDIIPKLSVQYVETSKHGKPVTIMSNISSSDLDKWQQFSITVNNFAQGLFQLVTVEGRTSEADVAIDDISIKQGACGHIVTTHNNSCANTRSVTLY